MYVHCFKTQPSTLIRQPPTLSIKLCVPEPKPNPRTSITIPDILCVIDSGLARIKKHTNLGFTTRLPGLGLEACRARQASPQVATHMSATT